MNALAMVRCVALAAVLLSAATSSGQNPAGVALTYPSRDLVYPAEDLKGAATDVKSKADELKAPAAALDVKETATELKISLLGDILFDFDKADIRAAAEPTLLQVAGLIQKQPKANVLIEGHTDAKGSPSYNAKLSEKRAASVKIWFVTKGIAEAGIRTRGWGAQKPVAENTRPDGSDNPEGRQKNRRVEITIKK